MKNLIKSTAILAAIAGGAMGILLLIPFLSPFVCFAYSLIGAGIIVYLKKNNFIGIISVQDGALLGAVAGFISAVASSVIFIPIACIINLILTSATPNILNIIPAFLSMSFSFIVLLMLVIFIAILSAVFNSFSALIATYIYSRIEEKPESNQIDINL